MLYPKIGRNRSVTLNIPDFSGGIDASKPAQDIQDNQAVSLSNMWLKDGTMQTRPALKAGGEEASLSADYKMSDLGLDMTFGFSLYNSLGAELSETTRKIGRLFRFGKAFYFYDYESKKFQIINVVYNNEEIKNIFLYSTIESECFFENGTVLQKVGINEEVTDEYQIVHSKIYGYVILREENASKLRRFFVCAKFVYEKENIFFRFDMYDFEKEVPPEYAPYNPVVIFNTGTSAVNLDELNLFSQSFQQHIGISKSLNQYVDENSKFADGSYWVTNASGTAKHYLGDGTAKYGNVFNNKRINFAFNKVDNSKIDQIIIYGTFKFYTWLADYIEDTYDDSGERIPDGHYLNATYSAMSPANKLIISNIKGGTNACDYKYYSDKYNHVVDVMQSENYQNSANREKDPAKIYDIYPNRGTRVECTDELLSVWFPSNDYDVIAYRKNSDGTYKKINFGNYSGVEEIFIDEIHIFRTLISREDRADLIIKNPLKTTFGGTNSGYNSGTRLFVAGNPEHKNVLRWSAVNDFSYFLENNFTYIGRDDEEITALAKQDGYLVVFKERELYAVEYASSTDSNNELVVYFPVTPISPYIGCDCPQSIQFIANRLTWLTSGGKVYTLYSENSYSERNVREISKHIENELKKHTAEQLKAAKSADYNGNYMLFIENTVYIWNYDANPLYNYTSSERAQQNLCWFKWEFPYPVEYVCENNGELTIICSDGTDYQGYVLDYSEDADDTVGATDTLPITSTYKSKLWDFGSPFTFKRINRALFEVLTMNDGEVKIYFCTENGREPIPATLDAQYTTNENSTYTTRPHLTRVRSMGFELESDVAVKLYSAAATAEIYGEVK